MRMSALETNGRGVKGSSRVEEGTAASSKKFTENVTLYKAQRREEFIQRGHQGKCMPGKEKRKHKTPTERTYTVSSKNGVGVGRAKTGSPGGCNKR